MSRKIAYIVLLALYSLLLPAADTTYYTLSQCRELAVSKGASSQSQQELLLSAKYNRQAALAAMFPRITANASYMWNNANVHLLENSSTFKSGTATVNPDGTANFAWSDESVVGQIEEAAKGTAFEEAVTGLADKAGQELADGYKLLYDKLSPDMSQIFVAHVGVTQPIYVGGRLVQLYKIVKASEEMANLQSQAKHDEII